MPTYDYLCERGHAFEKLVSMADRGRQTCSSCGAAATKQASAVGLSGRADPGRHKDLMPQTWRGTYDGNPEYVRQMRGQYAKRQKLEEKYEELRGDTRPVLAHEGRFSRVPLRQGDTVVAAPPAHGHAHGSGQEHAHGPSATGAPAASPPPASGRGADG